MLASAADSLLVIIDTQERLAAAMVPAALEAVRQWVYSPTLLNGKPVEVIAPITVIFRLTR